LLEQELPERIVSMEDRNIYANNAEEKGFVSTIEESMNVKSVVDRRFASMENISMSVGNAKVL
jgi:hypothetical protein